MKWFYHDNQYFSLNSTKGPFKNQHNICWFIDQTNYSNLSNNKIKQKNQI